MQALDNQNDPQARRTLDALIAYFGDEEGTTIPLPETVHRILAHRILDVGAQIAGPLKALPDGQEVIEESGAVELFRSFPVS